MKINYNALAGFEIRDLTSPERNSDQAHEGMRRAMDTQDRRNITIRPRHARTQKRRAYGDI